MARLLPLLLRVVPASTLLRAALAGGAGCLTQTAPGLHKVQCALKGLQALTYQVPARCGEEGCGLIFDAHGWMGDADQEDSGTHMRALGDKNGYIVIQPVASPGTAGRPDWDQPISGAQVSRAEVGKEHMCQDIESCPGDQAADDVLQEAFSAWKIDRRKVHFMGFSAGGMMTCRMACRFLDGFASFVVIEGLGAALKPPKGYDQTKTLVFSCLTPNAPQPPILAQNGYKQGAGLSSDSNVHKVIANLAGVWKLTGPTVVGGDSTYQRTRYVSPAGVPFELLNHSFGHTIQPPTGYNTGEEAMKWFIAHPKAA